MAFILHFIKTSRLYLKANIDLNLIFPLEHLYGYVYIKYTTPGKQKYYYLNAETGVN
jgi:hypothetical protein